MKAQIGKTEKTGRNDGEHIKEYHKLYHLAYRDEGKNYPYCQMAQGYWLYIANESLWDCIEFMKTAGTLKAVRLALKQGLEIESAAIKKHDLLYWKKPGTNQGHVERAIEDFKNGCGRTIGANTSNGLRGSQREGDGIFERYRDFNKNLSKLKPYAVIHWNIEHSDITPFTNNHRIV